MDMDIAETVNTMESIQTVDLDRTDPGRSYFWPVSFLGGLFCVSIFAWIAAGFGDPQAPVNRWIDRYGLIVILVETFAVVIAGLLAMALDRSATLAKLAELKTLREQQQSADSAG